MVDVDDGTRVNTIRSGIKGKAVNNPYFNSNFRIYLENIEIVMV